MERGRARKIEEAKSQVQTQGQRPSREEVVRHVYILHSSMAQTDLHSYGPFGAIFYQP